MRTTLTIDPDVARLLEDEAHRTRMPFKQVVNDAIRRGLGPRPHSTARPYRVKAHVGGLRPGIDLGRFNALTDALEDAGLVRKLRRGRSA